MKPVYAITLESEIGRYSCASPDLKRFALRVFHDALINGTTSVPDKPSSLATKKQVSEYFQRTCRWVDLQVRAGRLKRLRTPGSNRGSRFRWSDIQKLEAEMLVEVGP